jgi:hypothetical protein
MCFLINKCIVIENRQLPPTSSTPPASTAETTPPPASSPAALAACSTPAVNELQCGWTGKSDCLPRPHIKDIENYLLHSSHRTEDSGKMQCYRQYIRGLNFYKEGYIHKVMYNAISDESALCYVRSKCYPSMKKGVYEQWLLLSKRDPFRVEKAGCTCPAGLVHFYLLFFSNTTTIYSKNCQILKIQCMFIYVRKMHILIYFPNVVGRSM